MGACDFENYIAKSDEVQTAEQAYRVAYDEAAYESGHGGYTGTIAEKSGFFMKQLGPVSREAAWPIVRAEQETQDKWGPAACLAIATTPTKTHKVTKTITVTHENGLSMEALTVAFNLDPGEWLTDVEVESDDRKYKTKARVNRGAAERKFLVGHQVYNSLDEAKAAVQKAHETRAARTSGYGPAAASTPITEIVTRGGEPAATVTTTLVSRKVKVTATRHTSVGGIGPVEGWLFFGLASC